jgi:nucleotidyltransferase/DNA polymerase involved in DNA repair
MSKKPQLSDISGIGEKLEEKLREAGIKTVLNLSRADAAKLADKVDGLGEKGAILHKRGSENPWNKGEEARKEEGNKGQEAQG